MLLQAEKIVLGNDGVVLRVAGIYGPDRSFLLHTVLKRDAIPGDRLVNQAHRDDVASAIFFVARSRALNPPRIFNVVDDTPVPRTEILQWLSARLGLPLSNSPSSAGTEGRRSNKRVSNAKLRALGWAPVYPGYREGFDRSVLPAHEGSGG
jgi:nucleoside-diphosphate-sugar epimerase